MTNRIWTISGGVARSQPFTAAGEYPYYCTLHPRMTGKVVVAGA